ncbi:MAG: hypothetical protein AAGD38_07330 [Acidobacteriota bacterium]
MDRSEIVVLVLAAVLGVGGLFAVAGGPVSWDELLYMDLSAEPRADPSVLNRYVHIYAQSLFMTMAGSPLDGARLYWAFLMVASGVLTYAVARRFTPSSTALTGVVAVGLLASQYLIAYYAGATYADFTVMVIGLVALVFYLWALDRPVLFLPYVGLGACLYLAARAKETGAALAVLAIGAVFLVPSFGRPEPFRRIAALAVGGGAALVAMACVDGLLLGDVLFSVRPSSWAALGEFNLGRTYDRTAENWFGEIGSTELMLLFTLFLASAWRLDLDRARRWVWMLPLALLALLVYTMVFGAFGVIPRYFLPVYPVLAVLAAQLFRFDLYRMRQVWPWWLGAGAVAVVFIAGTAMIFLGARDAGWEVRDYWRAIVFPLGLIALLALMVWVRKWSAGPASAALVAVAVLAAPTLAGGIDHIRRLDAPDSRFGPFVALEEPLSTLGPEQRIFVSRAIYRDTGMLGRNRYATKWMYTVYFDRLIEVEQIDFGEIRDLDPGAVDFVLVTAEEARELSDVARAVEEADGVVLLAPHTVLREAA